MMSIFSIVLASLLMISCTQINTDIQDIGEHSAYSESIARAHQLPDDTWIKLTGKIIRHEGGRFYIFQDSGDTIKIEIDDPAWKDMHFTQNMKVEITGKIDKTLQGTQIIVDKVNSVAD